MLANKMQRDLKRVPIEPTTIPTTLDVAIETLSKAHMARTCGITATFDGQAVETSLLLAEIAANRETIFITTYFAQHSTAIAAKGR